MSYDVDRFFEMEECRGDKPPALDSRLFSRRYISYVAEFSNGNVGPSKKNHPLVCIIERLGGSTGWPAKSWLRAGI